MMERREREAARALHHREPAAREAGCLGSHSVITVHIITIAMIPGSVLSHIMSLIYCYCQKSNEIHENNDENECAGR